MRLGRTRFSFKPRGPAAVRQIGIDIVTLDQARVELFLQTTENADGQQTNDFCRKKSLLVDLGQDGSAEDLFLK